MSSHETRSYPEGRVIQIHVTLGFTYLFNFIIFPNTFIISCLKSITVPSLSIVFLEKHTIIMPISSAFLNFFNHLGSSLFARTQLKSFLLGCFICIYPLNIIQLEPRHQFFSFVHDFKNHTMGSIQSLLLGFS